MLPLIDTVRTQATVGEIMNTLADVFGRYQKPFIEPRSVPYVQQMGSSVTTTELR